MSPELALVKSQAELNRAKAEEARASARRSSGEENRAEKLFPQEAELLGLTVENQKTQNLINSLNAELFADTYSFKVSEAAAKLEQIYKQNELTDAEIADYQSAIAYRAVQSELARKDIELKDAQIVDTLAHAKLNKQMIQESFAKIGLINAQEMAEWSRKYNLDYASEKLASENELLKKDIDTYDSRYWNKIITSYARSGSDVLEAIVDLIRVFKKNGGEEDQFNNAMSEVASEVDWSQMWQVATTMVE